MKKKEVKKKGGEKLLATCGAKVLFQQGFKQGSETKVKKML